jgi:hypothetical protein
MKSFGKLLSACAEAEEIQKKFIYLANAGTIELTSRDYIVNNEIEQTTKENCRNCGSSHTRVKKGVKICSYCGSHNA